jgi:hypothetical protein
MKTSQEIVDYLVDVIANIYRKPQMYAERASELESVLLDYHSILDFALDRYGRSISLNAKFWCDEFGPSTIWKPDWWHERVASPDSPIFNALSSVGAKSIRSLD